MSEQKENRILVIDDEDRFRANFRRYMENEGYLCEGAEDAESGLEKAGEFQPDVIFLDIVMPGRSGPDVLDDLTTTCPETPVVMITAYESLETAVDSFQKGAIDYITKPLQLDAVCKKIEHVLEFQRLKREVSFLRRWVSGSGTGETMIGESEAMETIRYRVGKVAPTSSTVIITGESGSGKERVARAVHQKSERNHHPFMAINCAGIPEDLLERELFGHKQGAFTGAEEDRPGFCEAAGNGTLFLDEIAEMSFSLQSTLLRVLEEEEFYPVGGTEAVPLHARVIASTNRDVDRMVEENRFREDLYYRIAVFEIDVPPLRERRRDIPLLVEHFVREFTTEMSQVCLGVDNDCMRYLLSYNWPGNVRELRNAIERALIVCSGDTISSEDLPEEITGSINAQDDDLGDDLREAVEVYERAHIRQVLKRTDGNKREAARRLNISPATLYNKLKE